MPTRRSISAWLSSLKVSRRRADRPRESRPAAVRPHDILREPVVRITSPTGDALEVRLDGPFTSVMSKVEKFLREQRERLSLPVRRGRQRGMTGIGVDTALAVVLAYLHYRRGVSSKIELLKVCHRGKAPFDYAWLNRRLRLGRPQMHRADQFNNMRVDWVKRLTEHFAMGTDEPMPTSSPAASAE
jgi:hypothetical protein